MNFNFRCTETAIVLMTLPFAAEGAVLAGTFDWARASDGTTSTASFVFDVESGDGMIRDLNPFFYDYGSWTFRLSVSGQNTFGSRIVISTFEDLTNFGTREITLMPAVSFEGVPITPYTIEGDLQWNLSAGSLVSGTLADDSWSALESNLFNLVADGGTVGNFIVSIPEPSITLFGLGGLGLLMSLRRTRTQTEEAQQDVTPNA